MECKRCLYLAGKPQVAIVRALHCINVNKSILVPLIVSVFLAGLPDVKEVGEKKQQHQQKWCEN